MRPTEHHMGGFKNLDDAMLWAIAMRDKKRNSHTNVRHWPEIDRYSVTITYDDCEPEEVPFS